MYICIFIISRQMYHLFAFGFGLFDLLMGIPTKFFTFFQIFVVSYFIFYSLFEFKFVQRQMDYPMCMILWLETVISTCSLAQYENIFNSKRFHPRISLKHFSHTRDELCVQVSKRTGFS